MKMPRLCARDDKGQAAVEFALSAVFLVLFVVSLIEITMLVYTYIVLADSAKEGVRYAIVHGSNNVTPSGPTTGGTAAPPCTASSANVGNVQTAVTNYAGASLHDKTQVTVNVCYFDGDNLAPHRVAVAVSYAYQPFFGLGWPTVNVKAAAQGRIVF
jgi:Flp pilus assembly protein TadG